MSIRRKNHIMNIRRDRFAHGITTSMQTIALLPIKITKQEEIIMANLNNFGIVSGRLTKDPTVFANSDGSKKIMVTVAAKNNYKGKDGKRGTQFVDLQAFVSAKSAKSPFDYLEKGDKVKFGFSVRNNNYTDKQGVAHYEQILWIEDTELEETKASKAARAAREPQAEAAAAGVVPAADDDSQPFDE